MKEKLKNDAVMALVTAAVSSRLDLFVFLITFPIVFACFSLISFVIVKSGAVFKSWVEMIIKFALLIMVVLTIVFFSVDK